MFAISALLLAFDFMLVMTFFGQADSAVQKSNEGWDFRIAELRQVDAKESDAEVAGVSIEREKVESQPTPEPTSEQIENPETIKELATEERDARHSVEVHIDGFGFHSFLDEDESKRSPYPYWPAYYQFR